MTLFYKLFTHTVLRICNHVHISNYIHAFAYIYTFPRNRTKIFISKFQFSLYRELAKGRTIFQCEIHLNSHFSMRILAKRGHVYRRVENGATLRHVIHDIWLRKVASFHQSMLRCSFLNIAIVHPFLPSLFYIAIYYRYLLYPFSPR